MNARQQSVVLVGTLLQPVAKRLLQRNDTPRFGGDQCPSFAGDFKHRSHRLSPTDFGGEPQDEKDDADAIQQAIDSGKPVVYLPNGVYHVSRPIIIRGDVRKIVGTQSAVEAVEGAAVDPIFRFVGDADSSVIMEHIRVDGKIEHAGAGTLVFRHGDHLGYRNTADGTGDAFFEDVIGAPYIVGHGQSFWGRAINSEFGTRPLFENHGGNVWLLGFKTEGEMTCLLQTAGRTEMLGCLFYPLKNRHPRGPAIINQGGTLSASVVMNSRGYQLFLGAAEGEAEHAVTQRAVEGRHAPLIYSREEEN